MVFRAFVVAVGLSLFSIVALAGAEDMPMQDIRVQPLDAEPPPLPKAKQQSAASTQAPHSGRKPVTASQLRDPSRTYRLPGGALYSGQWNNRNQPHGRGYYVAAKGDEYRGHFSQGLFAGEGMMFFVNGDTYRGSWQGGKQNGQGVMEYRNGDIYQGRWQNGLRHGRGVLMRRSGSRYEGDWKFDQRDGDGMYIAASGQRYLGQYQANKPHGQGVEVNASGDSYNGTFSRGQRHGVGECAPKNADLSICLFDRGQRIFDPQLLARAESYYQRHKPKYQFQGGLGFLLEDHYTRQRQWLAEPDFYWQLVPAWLATELRLYSKSDSLGIRLIIGDYHGPGEYELSGRDFRLLVPGTGEIGLADGERVNLSISTDSGQVIEGKFNASQLRSLSVDPARSLSIRNGRFEARVAAD